MARYTQDQRAAAVAMLVGEGYPDKKGALSRTARHCKLPISTLHRWYYKAQEPLPPPERKLSELVETTKKDLANLYLAEILEALKDADFARSEASYHDLIWGVGVLTDKIQLLTGGATANVANVVKIVRGVSMDDV